MVNGSVSGLDFGLITGFNQVPVPVATPEPSTIFLLVAGLAGFCLVRSRTKINPLFILRVLGEVLVASLYYRFSNINCYQAFPLHDRCKVISATTVSSWRCFIGRKALNSLLPRISVAPRLNNPFHGTNKTELLHPRIRVFLNLLRVPIQNDKSLNNHRN